MNSNSSNLLNDGAKRNRLLLTGPSEGLKIRGARNTFSPSRRNLIKVLQNETKIALITKSTLIFSSDFLKMANNGCQKVTKVGHNFR